MFEQLEKGIYRVRIPYENVYTSVFLLTYKKECLLIDGGASATDAENYVLPALRGAGMRPMMILRSHCHGDHSGGVQRIAEEYGIKIGLMEDDFPKNGNFVRLYDGEILLNRFQLLNLKGHTDECLAVLDLKTKTLLSFDCLQMGGLDKYGATFTDKAAYLHTVGRVRRLRLRRIIASHDFEPFGFDVGKERIIECLNVCEQKANS